jgi:hypothetical protein
MLHMQYHKGALCPFFSVKEFAMKVVKAAAVQISPIDRCKALMDSAGHYNRPELLSLLIDRTPTSNIHERTAQPKSSIEQGLDDLRATVA